MANNCLVTKLRGVVNNDNLMKFGIITLSVSLPEGSSEDAIYGRLPKCESADKCFTYRIIGDGKYFTLYDEHSSQVKEITSTINGEISLKYPIGEYKIEITNKYKIVGDLEHLGETYIFKGPGLQDQNIGYLIINAEDLQYASFFRGFSGTTPYIIIKGCFDKINTANSLKAITLDYRYTNGSLYNISNLRLSNFNILGNPSNHSDFNINGTTNDISTILSTDGNRLTISNTTNITGDINAFSNSRVLRQITIYNTSIYGDLDNLLTSWSTQGNTNEIYILIGNWNGVQNITGERTSSHFNTGTDFVIKLNGDGTWDII